MEFKAKIKDSSNIIKALLAYEKITMKDLAGSLNVTTQNISKKFKHGDLRESDIAEIADIAGYDVEIHFIKRT